MPDPSPTTAASIAALLVGISMVDGEVDGDELRSLIDALRTIPALDGHDAAALGQRAYRELYDLVETDGDLLGAIRDHASRLGAALDAAALLGIVVHLEHQADADGEVSPIERRLIQAVRHQWGV